jgi:chemotaxis protein MotB
MAKAPEGGTTIIIKRIKKSAHEGHHGGAWKVAYADFVTAMMAFFLLLWLLNVTTDVQKRGIADYFDPAITMNTAASGADGILGGRVIGAKGSMTVNAAAPSLAQPMPSLRQPDDGDDGNDNGAPGKEDEQTNPRIDKLANAEKLGNADKIGGADSTASEMKELRAEAARDPAKLSDPEFQKKLAEVEERQFAAAEFALRQAIQDVPDLHDLAENLVIDRTPEGLRIQLVDQEKSAMFALGSSEMNDAGRKLMALVGRVVAKLPNKISVTGHTDATPFARQGSYGNWELSADRANASRRELMGNALPAERIAKVVGMADREPLLTQEPLSPRNRRISIVLLRETKPGGGTNLAQR